MVEKKIHQNLDNRARSGGSKTVDSEAVLGAIEENPVSCTWRVSGELGIPQSSVVCYLYDHGESIWNCQIVLQVKKNTAKRLTQPNVTTKFDN